MAEPFIGEIKLWGVTYAPRGWAFCYGQLMNIVEHQSLYSLLGTTYGGDGRVTFALPDLRGRVATHAGAMPGQTSMAIGQYGGQEGVILQESEIPDHTHRLHGHAGEANVQSPAGALLANNSNIPLHSDATNTVEMEDSTTSQGGGVAHNNIQPSLVMNYCIALVGTYPSRN